MATKMSMPAVTTIASPSISYPPAIKRSTKFPTYGADEEVFVLKLGVSAQQHNHIFIGKNTTVDDPEIDVFDAQRYFNEGLIRNPNEVDPSKLSSDHHLQKKDEPVASTASKMQSLRSTRSESSTNSRSALLESNRRILQPKKSVRKGFLASIGCNCSCVDRNSVAIDDCTYTDLADGKLQQGKTVRKTTTETEEEDQAKREAAIEANVSPVLENRKKSPSLEKKLNMMSSWDAIAEETKNPSISSDMKEGEDSDGSSDLFEIESLSKGGGQPFLSRQASDGLSGCYAPSEASIEWSVVTASAADFSVVSDSEEFGFAAATNKTQKGAQNSKLSSFKEIPKLRPGILSGCKSQKAVSVAGDAYRTSNGGRIHHKAAASFVGPTRFRDENKVGGFGTKIRPQSLDSTAARVLPPQSRSGNAAHLLYV